MNALAQALEVEAQPKEARDSESMAPAPDLNATAKAADESLYLVGRPTLRQFLRFVRGNAVDPPDEATLLEEWHAASRVIGTLEKEEAGLADDPPMKKLGPEYEPLLIEFLKDPLVRHGFNTVPTDVTWVELDRLVVYQKHIDLTFVRELKHRLGPAPTPEQVFRTCLPYDHPQPPVKWRRLHRNSFVFMSPSNDLRFLGTMRMQAKHIADYPPPGNVVGVIGIAVGFGSNFLNAVYAEKRLILNNGSHRAYALREIGVTHVPCIVQHVSSRAELDVVAATAVEEKPGHFLNNPRPPMLKDYFDPRLRKVLAVERQFRQVTVKFEVDHAYIPAL